MTINAIVVGIRIWPRSTGSQRVIDIQWSDPVKPEHDWVYHSMQLVDQEGVFNLLDQVVITIEHSVKVN